MIGVAEVVLLREPELDVIGGHEARNQSQRKHRLSDVVVVVERRVCIRSCTAKVKKRGKMGGVVSSDGRKKDDTNNNFY